MLFPLTNERCYNRSAIVCKIDGVVVYDMGYNKMMEALRNAPRPLAMVFEV